MDECLFCRIANHQPEALVWEDDAVAAFPDIHPKAPVHVLVVPKRHTATLGDLDDPQLAGQLLMAVRAVAEQAGLQSGYRVVVNVGRSGGQVVDHLHIHVLGGKKFSHDEIEQSSEKL